MRFLIKYETSNKKIEVSLDRSGSGLFEAIGCLTILISIIVCCTFFINLISSGSCGEKENNNEHFQSGFQGKYIAG
jgi:hypothetical protein